MLDEYSKLRGVVPTVPERLMDDCSAASADAREKIMIRMRISSLLPMSRRRHHYPEGLLPPQGEIFAVLHTLPEDAVLHVTPQQVSDIAELAEYVHKNPKAVIKAARARFLAKQYGELEFMCCSTIPAFFGFFSCAEHINAAFPFYCSLITTSEPDLVYFVLLPFYCSACTYRYVEAIYDKFGLPFCHDPRLNQEAPQKKVLQEYVARLVAAIHEAFPLLPDTHQFLLRFMVAKGWERSEIVDFFFCKFTLVQLLRHVKATAFSVHFAQLRDLAVDLRARTREFVGMADCFDTSGSFFEIPPAFTCFGVPFTHLLLTTLDVNVMIQALRQVNELPRELLKFVEGHYLAKIDLQPIWIRVYLRKPKPVETSYNWRNVVFALQVCEVPKNRDFARMWRQLLDQSMQTGRDPIEFLRGQNLTYFDIEPYKAIKAALGQKYDEFIEYAIVQNTHDLQVRSQVFERYLVDVMSRRSLVTWQSLIDGYYSDMVIPTAITTTDALMQNHNTVLDLDISIVRLISLPRIRQLAFMTVISHLLPELPKECVGKFSELDTQWNAHIQLIRETIRAPRLGDRSDRTRAETVLRQKLWSGIHHMTSLNHVRFEWALDVVLDSLGWLDGLSRSEDVEAEAIQYAVAFSECSRLLSRFICVNIFVMKNKSFRAIDKTPRERLLWTRFEAEILKLLERDPELMQAYLILQGEVARYRPLFGSVKVGEVK
jgi:hypothetical protein